MNWNDYRTAMDELPVSEDFERRVCAATMEAQKSTRRDVCPHMRLQHRVSGLATRIGVLGKAAAVVAICLVLGGTAYAVVSFDDLVGIASDADESQIANAFAQGDGVRIDETQRVGDFDITLLGIAPGQALCAFTESTLEDRTYAVVSLTRSDGAPLDDDYLAQSYERYSECGAVQGDGSVMVGTSMLPKGEEGFEASSFLIDNLCLTPIAATGGHVFGAQGDLGYTTYAKDGAIYLVADFPAAEGDAPISYLAVWLGDYAGSDLPGNRFNDRIVASERDAPAFAEGVAGALFELPMM